jgi:hypothetical protein
MQDNWPVSVATEHPTVTKKEFRKMVMYILALSLYLTLTGCSIRANCIIKTTNHEDYKI